MVNAYAGAMSETRDIRGSVIVITGASSGIGLATAKAMLSRGARVVLGARDISSLSELVATSSGSAVAQVCDIVRHRIVQRLWILPLKLLVGLILNCKRRNWFIWRNYGLQQ